ncbi:MULTISPECIES: murein hydrolase activator EnvC family protein [Spirosoma]|uniref:Peptidoglycan DD-metalloendopeptidase family protein n=1 Tax=Spirosoma liriopis TaxID=2937440 RepID=A0ABT0HH95_9BACT|nr:MULTISPECIES: peptidoglycan DD-metalloendopeptidase family protein [Spirosoma]MCK8491537.1 peptidoglycan DD-metalloendopeptidase family protein [Spirosoma liriopis]UHG93726.1 peptidoglycan DD-metalloendopeptidase family protein [Spirosoma oryzicola]
MAQLTQRNRQTLEKEKKQNLEKMGQIRNILKQTASEKQVGLGQLKALNQQISTQSQQINLLNKDLRLTETEIGELRQASTTLKRDLSKLKAEYGSMVYAADKRRQQVNPMGFLFASDNFNQLVARYRYLRQYSDARQSQVRQMNNVQTMLQGKQEATQRKRKEQQGTLTTKVNESKKLESLKEEKNLVVKELSQKETELRTELAESRRSIDRLEAMIKRLIVREAKERAEREARERAERERIAKAEAARKAAERRRAEEAIAAAEKAGEKPAPADVAKVESPPAPEPKKPDERRNNNLNDEETALASSFTASRSRLPWPVGKGFISDRFGRKPHPVLKGIYVENQGVDIQTNAGEGVRSVYDGVVQDVTNMPGMNNVVAIQHGDYFTVYAKLKSVSVRVGQRVKARESIGTVATDKNGVSEIQFQIWKEFTKLNPESWLQPH